MSGVADFADMMPFEVTVKAITGRDRYGKETYTAGTVYKAHIENRIQQVTTNMGEDVTSTTMVILLGAPAVEPDSVIDLPDGSSRPVMSVGRDSDELGWHHTTLYL